MQLNLAAVKFGKMQLAVVAAITVSILLWSFFLNAGGLSVNDFFTFQLDVVLEKMISWNFLLFLLTFPATGAIITAFAKRMEKTNLMLYSIISGFFALAIAMVLFHPLQGFWIVAVFYIIAIPLCIEIAYIKYSELKNLVSLRTFLATAGRGATVVAIGLFALSAITILADQEAYIEKFESTFIENVFQGFTSGKGQQQLTGSAADMVISARRDTLEAAVENPLFEKLRGKDDPDVIAFVNAADDMLRQIESPEYRAEVEKQFAAGTTQIGREIDFVGLLKEQLPFLETIERFFWLVHGFIIVSAFFLIANIIFKPAAGVYGLLFEKILSLAAGKRNRGNQPQKIELNN